MGKAMEWALLARALSAAEAERWGLVNRVVPLDRLEQETMEIARELAEGPTLVLGYTKSAVLHGWQTPPETAHRHQGQAGMIRHPHGAFTKRPPAFLGQTPPPPPPPPQPSRAPDEREGPRRLTVQKKKF